jgi:hypothetical protein
MAKFDGEDFEDPGGLVPAVVGHRLAGPASGNEDASAADAERVKATRWTRAAEGKQLVNALFPDPSDRRPTGSSGETRTGSV